MIKFSWNEMDAQGRFIRSESAFREAEQIVGDDLDRYHLYVSLACPWASRTLVMRNLKGLEHAITVDVVDHFLGSDGWRFVDDGSVPGATPDRVNGFRTLREVYTQTVPGYTGKCSVPVLYDKKEKKIVNNESSEIIRIMNSKMNAMARHVDRDFYPASLQAVIDETNSWVYQGLNNGVYRAGFATSQLAYEEACRDVFAALDRIEQILAKQPYICGDAITEADVRLFTTLVRFDVVYHGHFKCNVRRIVDYHNVWNYAKELFQIEAFGSTVNLEHCKKHYYCSHRTINPHGVVPLGPRIDFMEPHDREAMKAVDNK